MCDQYISYGDVSCYNKQTQHKASNTKEAYFFILHHPKWMFLVGSPSSSDSGTQDPLHLVLHHPQHMVPKVTCSSASRWWGEKSPGGAWAGGIPGVKRRTCACHLHLHFIGSSVAIWPDETAKDAGKKVPIGVQEKAELGSTTLLTLVLWSWLPPLWLISSQARSLRHLWKYMWHKALFPTKGSPSLMLGTHFYEAFFPYCGCVFDRDPGHGGRQG